MNHPLCEAFPCFQTASFFPTLPAASAIPPKVLVCMGSTSDWPTLEHTHTLLKQFNIPHVCQVVSAHRTPHLLAEVATQATHAGIQLIIAGAGGAAHLPGMLAAHTTLPVLGVPVESAVLKGQDSLLSIVQMPAGIPVGTLAIGKAGAVNAGLLAVSILALNDTRLQEALEAYRHQQTKRVLEAALPPLEAEA